MGDFWGRRGKGAVQLPFTGRRGERTISNAERKWPGENANMVCHLHEPAALTPSAFRQGGNPSGSKLRLKPYPFSPNPSSPNLLGSRKRGTNEL